MAQQAVDFRPIAQGGDSPTAAFVKLDGNDKDLDTRVTAIKATADSAMPKGGGAFTGPVTGTAITASGPVVANGGLATNQYLGSSGNTCVLYASGAAAGQIILRPRGAADGTGQVLVSAQGILGASGGYSTIQGTNSYKIGWANGAAEFYVDSTKIGNIAFATSDPRLKKNIVYLDSATDGDNDQLTVLAAKPVQWEYQDKGLWRADGVTRRSFLSPELQDIDPVLAIGDRDAVSETGEVEPLNLNTDALISVLWGALRREIQLRRALDDRIAALEAGKN